MGEIVTVDNGEVDGKADEHRSGRRNGTGSKSADTASCGSGERAVATSGRRTGTGSGESDGNTITEKEVVSGLASVDESEKKRLERNEKRRQKYAEEKAQNGGQAKPRKTKSKTKTKNAVATFNSDTLTTLIMSLSAVVASRENCGHWLITESEAKSIAEPLQSMMAESQYFEKVGQYSNQIALVMACATIFMPRLIITISQNKDKKGENKNVRNVKTINDGRRMSVDEKKNSNEEVSVANSGNSTASSEAGSTNVTITGLSVY